MSRRLPIVFVTRFAPSPTGHLHLGNARTALLSAAWAWQHQGRFLLRIDDTDTARNQDVFAQSIQEDLAWLDVPYDDLVYQSKRAHLYQQAIQTLKEAGRLYPCYETPDDLAQKREAQRQQNKPPRYDRAALTLSDKARKAYEAQGCTPHWRFHLKDQPVIWQDAFLGELCYDTQALSDPVVVRADGTPSFLLTGSVDEVLLGVTHILRGEDHISNTAIQQEIIQALAPDKALTFAHIPLLKDEHGRPLSKRLGSLTLGALKQQGFFADAVRDFLLSMGTAHSTHTYTSRNDIREHFSLKAYGKASPKLSWGDLTTIQTHTTQALPTSRLMDLMPQEKREKATPAFIEAIRHNIATPHDLEMWYDICFQDPAIPPSQDSLTQNYFKDAQALLPPEPWDEH
ncbi:glutamate--tRNA ligase, partial [Candidatus Hepatobacter penaei]|uniref:glutamate--tRNA ligase n=1 Tax=Candidatus Hepatobacter penaei TaxID=1274402 RepID=UPI0038BBFFBA